MQAIVEKLHECLTFDEISMAILTGPESTNDNSSICILVFLPHIRVCHYILL